MNGIIVRKTSSVIVQRRVNVVKVEAQVPVGSGGGGGTINLIPFHFQKSEGTQIGPSEYRFTLPSAATSLVLCVAKGIPQSEAKGDCSVLGTVLTVKVTLADEDDEVFGCYF